jgi:ABC-type phosphate transport system substrate-binding protein
MRPLSALLLVSLLGLGSLWVSASHAVSEESLLVIVHAELQVERVSGYEIEALFTRAQTRWDDGSTVYPFSFPAGSSPRESFDRVVLRLSPEQVGRFWLDRRIRGLGMPPKQVPTATMMVQIVANLPGSIGYVPAMRTKPPGVKVVARIVQGKVMAP